MATYSYRCLACGKLFEEKYPFGRPLTWTFCPDCGYGADIVVVSAPAIHFKGGGWASRG